MTGGRVVVLGKTGRNFAAGMSGGIAYIYDYSGEFKDKCNTDMVQLEPLNEEDIEIVKALLGKHYKYTSSHVAENILSNFYKEAARFVKVMPLEYKRVLKENGFAKKLDLSEVSDG
jgi:glutamate synthase (ferredoxin)